jgi:F-type H+-transporting ATPase subunit b
VSPGWSTFLFEVANFLLLAAVLGWAFFRPVRAALEERRARIANEEQEAAEKLAEAKRAASEATSRRGEFEASLASLRERVRQDAEQERERLLDAAREQSQRERETLDAELAGLRRGQAKRLAADAAAAAREVVERLLEKIEGPDLEHALARAASQELAKLAAAGPVAPVIVESPAPISPEARESLVRAAGVADGEFSVRVVPELGTGVRVLTARGVIDASATGLAGYAERALLARVDAEGLADG